MIRQRLSKKDLERIYGSPARSKYRAVRTVVDGTTFDSKAEARRYAELKAGELGGLVHDLELQPEYPIVVAGRRICVYRADFRYYHIDGELFVEDVKGFKTPVYRLKKKLVEAQYDIQIREIA